MKKNLAIIGASYLQLPLIERAKELGYTTHVFAWAANDVGETAADVFYPISIVEKDQILEICRGIGICGICSIASDLAAVTVNYVAAGLGLSGNSPEATLKSTNKHQMRLAFEQCGDPSPKSVEVNGETELTALSGLSYPVIVKPTDRSGSRGIYKLTSPEGMQEAIHAAMAEGFEKKALVEEFAEGEEYSVEGISYRGQHTILAMTLKYTTGAPHFIETGHLQPAPVDEPTFERVKAVVMHALDSLGIENGASHSELKIDDKGNIKLIEIGGRMGGDCIGSDLVRLTTGVDYLRAVIQVACGEAPNLTPEGETQAARVVFVFSEADKQEFERIRAEEPERLLRVVDDRHFDNIGQTTDSSNRAGCYIVKA